MGKSLGRSERPLTEDASSLDRIGSFSDAVFAVAITLLVLSIDVPQGVGDPNLASQIWALWPKFMAFAMSFAIVGFFWYFHHEMFRYLKRYDYVFIFLNMTLLMCIVFMPFASELISEYGNTEIATQIYAGSWSLASLVMAVMWHHAAKDKRLVAEDFDGRIARISVLSFGNNFVIFTISIGIAFVNASAGQFFWIALLPTHVIIQRKTDTRKSGS